LLVLAIFGAASCGGESKKGGTSTRVPATAPSAASRDQDFLRAEKSLLTATDLGEGWEAEDIADDPVVPAEFACFQLEGKSSTAHAQGDLYAIGGPSMILGGEVFPRGSHVVSSAVNVYGSRADAAEAFAVRTGDPRTASTGQCLIDAESIENGPEIKGGKAALYLEDKFPALGDETLGANYILTFEKDKRSKVYVDVVVIRDERAVGVAFLSSLDSPPLSQAFSFDFLTDTAKVFADRLAENRPK
jgi:hypothetical protein